MTTIRDADRLRCAAHELSHAALAMEFGLEVPRVDVYRYHEKFAGETTVETARHLAQDTCLSRTARGVDAIVCLAGHFADALLGVDGAANDRKAAWRLMRDFTKDEVFLALDEARDIVRRYWPKITKVAPILARLGSLDGDQVRQLLKG
jgi:hypothetical protein